MLRVDGGRNRSDFQCKVSVLYQNRIRLPELLTVST